MTPVENSPLFAPWQDPVTGVTSHLLRERVAPIQQSFYFTNRSFSRDGRYHWFYCAFPPGGDAYQGRSLGVADFAEQEVRWFPETQFADASPCVDERTGEAFWTTGLEVWSRGPGAQDTARRVGEFPAELARGRRPLRLATHLGFSADRASLIIDAQIGNEWFAGDLPLDVSGFRLWQRFDRCYNHAQFSPVDPGLMLIAQDTWTDASTGAPGSIDDRLWLLRRGETARPVHPDDPSPLRGHEWWDPDGEHIWYVRYHHGTERVNIRTGQRTLIPGNCIHSHADGTGQYIVSDTALSPEEWAVTFTNAASLRTVAIVSHLPAPAQPRRRYHVHPHPQFCLEDRYICYTTNVLGAVDVAFASVAELIERTS